MKSECPDIVVVESGNISSAPEKLEITAELLAGMGYDAVGIGTYDLRLGEKFFEATAAKNLTILDAYPDAKTSTKPYLIKNVGGIKVGIMSFGEYSDRNADFEFRKHLYGIYKTVRESCDVFILLDQGKFASKDWLKRNAQRLGSPDFVIGTFEQGNLQKPEEIGKTMVVPTASKGSSVGVLDVTVGSDKKLTVDYKDIRLTTSVVEDEQVLKKIKEFGKKSSGRMAEAASAQPAQVANVKSSKPYYPSLLCKACHESQYEDWEKTDHAKAIKTLAVDNKLVPECLTCHSELYRFNNNAIINAQMKGGIECVTCHANSLPHGAERAVSAAKKSKVDPKICVSCHVKEHSPQYEETGYMHRVAHKTGQNTTASVSK